MKLFKTKQDLWITIWIVSAFLGMISFFQINSYQADKHHLNTFWLVTGIVLALNACYFCYKSAGGGGGYDGGGKL